MAKIKPQQILRYSLIGIVVLVVVAVGYRIYQIRKEKYDFAQAEIQIDELAKKIQEKIGQPTEIKKEKKCSRASAKFSKGDLGCSVTLRETYAVDGYLAANSMLSNASLVIDSPLRDSLGRNMSATFLSEQDNQRYVQSILDDSPLKCGIQYTYLVAGELQIEYTCGKRTLIEVYPSN